MPRLLASMIRFSIWSDMPRPCRPPMALASITRSTAVANSLPLMETGRPWANAIVTSSAGISTSGSQNLAPMIGSTSPIPVSRGSSDLGSGGGPPILGAVQGALCVAARVGQAGGAQPLRHLLAAAELVVEVGVQPRLVDPQ